MARCSWCQSIPFILLLFHLSKANVIFTSRPPNPTYVNNGSTAKLVWDYSDPNNVVGIAFSVLVTGKGFKRMLFKENGVVQDHQDLPEAYRGRINMTGKATLVITKVTPKDNTMFRCWLFDNINDPKDTVQLTVAEAPKIRLSSLQGIYTEGSFVNISCIASGEPGPHVTWIRKGIKESSGKMAAFLIRNSVRRTDEGVYTCRAKNTVKISSQNTTLLVYYKPEDMKLETSAPSNTITQGDKVTFTCTVTAAKPQVSHYSFIFNGSEVQASNNNQYNISNVMRSRHYGKYKCMASNNAGNETSNSLVLNVNVPVQFTVLPQNITTNETNPISLNCDASGFPVPSITWTKRGRFLHDKKHLEILRSNKSDTGEYICTANNRVEQPKTARAYVLIQYPPIIQEVTQSTKKSWIGQIVTLKCVSNGVPTPILTWYGPSRSEVNRVTAEENRVEVKLRSERDFGDYRCNAVNGLNPSDDREIRIAQIKTPGVPSIAVDIQASSLRVRWTAPVDAGGSPITGYQVIILKGDTEINTENITDPRTTSYTFVNLERDTAYFVKVFARNFVFEGKVAEKAVKTKFEGPPATVEIEDLMSKTTESTITLKWKEPEDNGKEINYYTVYRRIVKDGEPGEWIKIQTVTDVSVRQVKITLERGKVYEFAVTAANELGESVKSAKQVEAMEISEPTGNDGSQTGGGGDEMNTAIYAGVAAAVILLIIGIMVIIVLWRRRKPSIHEEISVDRLGSANHYETEDGYQEVSRAEAAQTLQASSLEDEANYAQVDMTKKKNRRPAPTDEYAQVDKSKKTKKKPKKPGELEYAELGDLRAALTPGPSGATAAAAGVVRPPVYEGTDYADISQFGVPQPDPTYANVSRGDVTYSNLSSM